MDETAQTSATMTAAQFADHLRWLLGNHNFEHGEYDAASDAYSTAVGNVIHVNVSTRIPGTREGGSQQFTVTVAEVSEPAASAATCEACGAALEDGECPNGHVAPTVPRPADGGPVPLHDPYGSEW